MRKKRTNIHWLSSDWKQNWICNDAGNKKKTLSSERNSKRQTGGWRQWQVQNVQFSSIFSTKTKSSGSTVVDLKRKRTTRVPRRQWMCPKFKSLQQRVCQPNGLIKRSHFTSTPPLPPKKNLPSTIDVIRSPPNRRQAKGLGAECCSWAGAVRICRKHQQRLQRRREKHVASGRLRGEQAALFALAGFLFWFFLSEFVFYFILFFFVCGAKPQAVTRSQLRGRG